MATASKLPEGQYAGTRLVRDMSASTDPCMKTLDVWFAFDTPCLSGCTHLVALACHPDYVKLDKEEFESELFKVMVNLKRSIETRINTSKKGISHHVLHPSNAIWLLNLPDGSYNLLTMAFDPDVKRYRVKFAPFPSVDPSVGHGSYKAFAKVFVDEAPEVKSHLDYYFWSKI